MDAGPNEFFVGTVSGLAGYFGTKAAVKSVAAGTASPNIIAMVTAVSNPVIFGTIVASLIGWAIADPVMSLFGGGFEREPS